MEIKKSHKADLEKNRSTGFLIGVITALAALYACFEFTTREFKESDMVYSMASFAPEEEMTPITQQIFFTTPPPPVETPKVADIIDIVDNSEDITDDEVETTEATNEAISVAQTHTSPTMAGSIVPTIEDTDEDNIFINVEEQPEFPGGNEALMKWLAKNLRYPTSAQENGTQGRVVCQFVVNRDGSIFEPKVVKSVDPALDKEALRVIGAMPRWKAGKMNGKAARVRFTLPVTFRLQN